MTNPKPCFIRYQTDEGLDMELDLANGDLGRLESWVLKDMRAGLTVTITDATDLAEIIEWEQNRERGKE